VPFAPHLNHAAFSPTKPVVVGAEQQIQIMLPMKDNIPIGSYELVICASFKNTNLDDVNQWTLDVKSADNVGKMYQMV
jgi:hypothetical protein